MRELEDIGWRALQICTGELSDSVLYYLKKFVRRWRPLPYLSWIRTSRSLCQGQNGPLRAASK